MSILIGLPLTLFLELSRHAHHTVRAILIGSVLGLVIFTRISSRRATTSYAVQLACATAAFLSATLRVALGQSQPSIVLKALLYSLFSPDAAMAFIFPVAIAVLAGAHFEKNATPSKSRMFVICVVISLGTIVHVRWSQGLWKNPLMLVAPGICTYSAVLLLTSTLSRRPVSSSGGETTAA